MFYKEIKKLKKSELQELLATTLQQKATLERANASNVADLNEKYSQLNKWWSDRYNDLQNELELLADSKDEEIDQLKKELEDSDNLLAETYTNYENAVMESKIHKREKQEAREIAENYSLSNNQLRNELAEGLTPKNIYIHEIETIFVDSGELHLIADEDKNLVFNCSNLVQDLATINDLVIQSAKRDLKDSIQQIKQLTKDI